MPINVKCQCGKTLKVDDKHRGKKAKCPACGNILLVEESDEDTGVQAEAPKKGRPSDDDDGAVKSGAPRKRAIDDDDDDRGDPDDGKPAKKKPAKSNTMMYLLVGGGAFGLLSCCCAGIIGGAVYWFYFRGSDEDLQYVHDGVAGFVSFRVADGWKNQAVQDAFKKMAVGQKKEMDDKIKEMEGKLGNKIEDLERVNVILRTADFNMMGRDPPDMIITYKTSRAMDKKKILDTIVKEGNKAKEKENKFDGGIIYTVGAGRDGMALYWASDKVLIMSPKEQTIKDAYRDKSKGVKQAALRRGVDAAQSGKYWFVMAAEVKKSWMDKLGPQAAAQAPNTIKTTGVIITSGLSAKETTFEAILTFENSDNASKAKTEVEGFVALAKVGLKAAPMKNAAVEKALDSVKVEHRGSEVIVSGKSSLDIDPFGPINPFGGPFGAGDPFDKEVAVAKPPPLGGPINQITFQNNMKQVVLAMHIYHDNNKTLPPQAIRDAKTGQPLLSWRVAILPYIEEGALYKQIKLDEPWNSPHNIQFANKMPRAYAVPNRPNDGKTHLQVFVGNETCFKSTKPYGMRMTDITDGSSNTILFVEAANSVNWMAPDDIPFNMGDAAIGNRVGNYWGNNTFQAAFADGTVRPIQRTIPWLNLQGFVTRNGGEVVPPG